MQASFSAVSHQSGALFSKQASSDKYSQRQRQPNRARFACEARPDNSGQPGGCSAVGQARSDGRLAEMANNPGIYYISGQTWDVGDRYTLVKVLGHGSFSSVCLAVDKATKEKVALKRIGDVLSSADNARKVLREVCILRRLSHPNIIALKDVFLKPSATGRLVMRGGALVPASLDIYIGMEYADRGDLYHMKGQLSETEVKVIMWQLLDAVRYLHAINVWHRDVKSANVLLTAGGEGQHIVKVADLGSARSAVREGYQHAEQAPTAIPPDPWKLAPGGGGGGVLSSGGSAIQPSSMEGVEVAGVSAEQLYARPSKEGGGFQSPLTTMVCTPCYRAPEVVMSRGGYTSALDMWSVGCIFGELLQRVFYLGKATTPHLSVPPVFAVQCAPITPRDGDKFDDKLGSPVTRLELEALFQVIGTPAWACIENVRSTAWRQYLRRLKGRAPSFIRRFGAAGEVAVDLLMRLLTFDPARRATAEEALAHEFFNSLLSSHTLTHPPLHALLPPTPDDLALDPTTPVTLHLPSAPVPPPPADLAADSVTSRLVSMDLNSPNPSPRPPIYPTASPGTPPGKRARPNTAEAPPPPSSSSGPTAAVRTPSSNGRPPAPRRGGGRGAGRGSDSEGSISSAVSLGANPAQALAELEEQMAAACSSPGGGTERLRALLVKECEAHAQQRGAVLTSTPISPTLRTCRSPAFDSWEHLQPDPAAGPGALDPEVAGEQRLPHHADTEQAQLEPEKHLRKNRHTEWAPTMLGGPPAGPSWGVTLHPPGVAAADVTAGMMDVLRRQNKR